MLRSVFKISLILLILFQFSEYRILRSQNIEPDQSIKFSKIADKLDPKDDEFPGGRGADELIIYTPHYGDSTGTNKYGIEAVVVDNRIQYIQGNNSLIPQNGFVISAHGRNLRWISQELFPGIEVDLNGLELIFKVTDESRVFYADYLISEVDQNLDARENLHESIDLKLISDLRNEIKSLKNEFRNITEKDLDDAQLHSDRILDNALEMYYKSFPSYDKEVRASWYHLKEKSPAELEETIKRMKEIGFNMICPEVIYSGYAIYPDAHEDLEQHPDYLGWDPMKELVRLCDKHKMKLVPWVWVFFVGRENSPLVKSRSDWLAISRQNEIPARLESNYHFFCPSRIEVTKFWLEVYRKVLENYDFDGLQLDYIRYPVSLPNEHGFCYCEVCRNNFKSIAQVDPLEITADNNPKLWGRWIEYRKDQITNFVGKVDSLIADIKPDVKLSADVFPLFEESINYKFQDWGRWLNEGYLDEIFTMSYKPEAEEVKYESKFLVEHLPEGIKGYVGLGPFMGFRPEILVKEIFYVQEAGADGICLFSFGSLSAEQIEALQKGPFRFKASTE